MADKAGQVQQLADALSRVLTLHEAEFAPARPPRAAAAVRPSETELYDRHLERAMYGVGRLQFAARKAAKEAAREAARREADEMYARSQARQVEKQQRLDVWWRGILANDPDLVLAHLAAAFEDNEAAAAPLSVVGDAASLVVILPALTDLPDRMPGVTPSGNPSLRKMTKSQASDLYKIMSCGIVLVTLKEAFAVAPGLHTVTVVGIRPAGRDAYGAARGECLVAATFTRSRLDGVRWKTTDSVTIMNDVNERLMVNERGAGKTWSALDLRGEPELQAVVDSVELDELVV